MDNKEFDEVSKSFNKKFKIAGGLFAAWFVLCATIGIAFITLIVYILFRVAILLS